MPLEIERKFLVANELWRGDIISTRRMRDGLLSRFGDGKVRVRITEEGASLTVKGPRTGFSRAEYEYPVPLEEAEELLALCEEPLLEKTRFFVPHDGMVWQVDVHEGVLQGLVLAELELEREDQPFALPAWIGREVTGDPSFKKGNLFRIHGRGPSAMPR